MILFSTRITYLTVCKNFAYDEKTDSYSAARSQKLKEHKKWKVKQTDERKMTHTQSRVCEGNPGYVPSVYGSTDLWKKYVLSLE